jgi:hypothetical protein
VARKTEQVLKFSALGAKYRLFAGATDLPRFNHRFAMCKPHSR